MTEPASVSVSRRIDAPADLLFEILADPARHPEVDASGMVRRAASESKPVTAVGDVFVMQMHNEHVDDYVMSNHVVEFEAGRRIVWEPVMIEVSRPEHQERVGVRAGHRWGYELEPDGEATVVTETFDCTRGPEWLRIASKNGETWIPAITGSLENLERIAATAASGRHPVAGE